MSDLFDQSEGAPPLELARRCRCRYVRPCQQIGSAPAVDSELALLQGSQQDLLGDVEAVSQRLHPIDVGHAQESVVFLGEVDAFALERDRQCAAAVAAELQAKRRPGGHAQVAQAELFAEEIELAVQALTQLRAKEGIAAGLVVPGLVARAAFHRGGDMYQARRVTARTKHPRHQFFLADVALNDVLDLNAGGRAHLLCPLPDTIPQRLGKLRVVEDADAVLIQKTRQAARVARTGKRACDDDPVETRQYAVQIRRISLGQCQSSHGRSLRRRYANDRISCLVPDRPDWVSSTNH